MSKSTLSVVDQVVSAFKPSNRLATTIGAVFGGSVPLAVYVVVHREVDLSKPLWQQPAAYLALGGLAYSAPTVYQWACRVVASRFKAAGFVLLLEGIMVASSTAWLALYMLALLVAINSLATGCQVVQDRKEQRATTRTTTRANRRTSTPKAKSSSKSLGSGLRAVR